MQTVEQAHAIQGSSVVLMYRASKVDGTLITQADVDTITVHSQDLTDGTSIATQDFTAASTVFDTLQTDSRWAKDATGYNLAVIVPPTLLPDGDKEYQIDVKITFVNDETDQLRPYQITTQKTYGG